MNKNIDFRADTTANHLSAEPVEMKSRSSSPAVYIHPYLSALAESFVCNLSPSCPLPSHTPKPQTGAMRNTPRTTSGGELLRKLHLSREKCVHMWAMGWKCLFETSSHSCSNCWPQRIMEGWWRGTWGRRSHSLVIYPQKNQPHPDWNLLAWACLNWWTWSSVCSCVMRDLML